MCLLTASCVRMATVLAVFMTTPLCSAQTVPSVDLKVLNAKYEQGLIGIQTAIDKALGNWPQSYIAELKKVEQKLQASGDLDGMLAVRKERERFEKEKKIPDGALSDSAVLKDLQLKWRKTPEAIELDRSKRIVTLAKSYMAALDEAKKELTKQGKIEEAIAAKTEVDRVKASGPYPAAEELLSRAGIGWKSDSGQGAVTAVSKPAAGDNDAAPADDKPATVPGKAANVRTLDLGDGITMELVQVPSGSFTMLGGGRGGRPIPVKITKPFYLGQCEVTQEQWEKIMGQNPSKFKGGKNPVENVSWSDCQDFLGKLRDKIPGVTLRLPTEAEWEYACRAGSKTEFCFGSGEEKMEQYAWFSGNANRATHVVGTKKPNAWGLFDMHGNVMEWCSDWGGVGNEGKVAVDPVGPASGQYRMCRGGCYDSGVPQCGAVRSNYEPGTRYSILGFRVVAVAR